MYTFSCNTVKIDRKIEDEAVPVKYEYTVGYLKCEMIMYNETLIYYMHMQIANHWCQKEP